MTYLTYWTILVDIMSLKIQYLKFEIKSILILLSIFQASTAVLMLVRVEAKNSANKIETDAKYRLD